MPELICKIQISWMGKQGCAKMGFRERETHWLNHRSFCVPGTLGPIDKRQGMKTGARDWLCLRQHAMEFKFYPESNQRQVQEGL